MASWVLASFVTFLSETSSTEVILPSDQWVSWENIGEGKEKKTWASPGFEPGTSRTRSANHTPRPTGLAHTSPSSVQQKMFWQKSVQIEQSCFKAFQDSTSTPPGWKALRESFPKRPFAGQYWRFNTGVGVLVLAASLSVNGPDPCSNERFTVTPLALNCTRALGWIIEWIKKKKKEAHLVAMSKNAPAWFAKSAGHVFNDHLRREIDLKESVLGEWKLPTTSLATTVDNTIKMANAVQKHGC